MRSSDHDSGKDVGTAATSSESGQPLPQDNVDGSRRRSGAVAAPIGAAGGAVAGAAVGTVTLGPIGTIVGAIAGALGGGWTALAASAPTHYSPDHEREYREHYSSDPERLADRGFETVRPAYQLGHLAARNPDYAGRDFESIESDLQRGWSDDVRAGHGDWSVARRYVREAFMRERARSHGRTPVELNMGGSETHQRPSFSDPIPSADPDRVTGERGVPGRRPPDGARS
jgi:hypothetical protein